MHGNIYRTKAYIVSQLLRIAATSKMNQTILGIACLPQISKQCLPTPEHKLFFLHCFL
jgi:hypothetical protein